MRVRPDSQTVEPEDFGARVMEATGRLVGRHPELLDSVEAGVFVPIMEISRRVQMEVGFGVPLGKHKDKGLPTMIYRAATDDYRSLARHMAWASVFAKRLAQIMGMNADEIETIIQGALLHDLGKVDPIIREYVETNGKISQDEKDVVGWHPELGARIAENFGIVPAIVAIIRDHHKRFDGNGYVAQNGDMVTIPPSIVQLADALDVMVRGRVGKEPLAFNEILIEVDKSNGNHFHPDVVNAFLKDPKAVLRRAA